MDVIKVKNKYFGEAVFVEGFELIKPDHYLVLELVDFPLLKIREVDKAIEKLGILYRGEDRINGITFNGKHLLISLNCVASNEVFYKVKNKLLEMGGNK